MKKVANDMMSSIESFKVKWKTRSELRSIVVGRMKQLPRDMDERSRRFVGDHVMALYGFGGGLY